MKSLLLITLVVALAIGCSSGAGISPPTGSVVQNGTNDGLVVSDATRPPQATTPSASTFTSEPGTADIANSDTTTSSSPAPTVNVYTINITQNFYLRRATERSPTAVSARGFHIIDKKGRISSWKHNKDVETGDQAVRVFT